VINNDFTIYTSFASATLAFQCTINNNISNSNKILNNSNNINTILNNIKMTFKKIVSELVLPLAILPWLIAPANGGLILSPAISVFFLQF